MRKVPRYICSRVPLNTDADLLGGPWERTTVCSRGEGKTSSVLPKRLTRWGDFCIPRVICQMAAISSRSLPWTYRWQVWICYLDVKGSPDPHFLLDPASDGLLCAFGPFSSVSLLPFLSFTELQPYLLSWFISRFMAQRAAKTNRERANLSVSPLSKSRFCGRCHR